jgi:hypothetical protein
MLTILKKKALALYVGNGIMKLLVKHQPGMEVTQNQKDRFGSLIKRKKDSYRGKNQPNGG